MKKVEKKRVIVGNLTRFGNEERPMAKTQVDPELLTVLINIHEKLNNPVFNGGFEALMSKVDGIQASQAKMEEHIEKVNLALYEPDEGLFSRIKNVEKEQNEKFKSAQLEMHVFITRLDSLEKTREFVRKILWLLVPASGGLLVKIFYEVLKDHVVLK